MRRFLSPVLVIAAAVCMAGTVEDGYPNPSVKKTLYAKNDLRGKKAPELKIEKWLNGAPESMKGKILFVDFWATWCGPCRELIPEVNQWSKKFGKDIVFVGLSNESEDTVTKFMASTKMDYHIAVDTKSQTSKALGVQGIPHVMIVSPDGIVRWQGFPGSTEDPLTEKVLEQIVKASRAGQERR
ncbi:MAG: TlpA family protein disulfide reductase [Armatimonadetes bacterium]|nr:TlpA family protein disulfide reductase [Armatimonadota bacterium]